MKTDIKTLLAQMSLTEKIGQITQVYPGSVNEGIESNLTGPAGYGDEGDIELAGLVGSVLGMSGAKEVRELQDYCMKKNRLGIPLLFMNDVIHGYRTIFPSVLGLGCTWDTELAKKCAEVAAKESAVSGNHVTFSPMVDLARDARWGRIIESPGEDPLLNSLFAGAFIEGYQGDDPLDKYRLACCVKHFAAYGAAEGGRDYNTTEISEYSLLENYLPPYRAAVEAGCRLVMTAFNCLNGVPATGSTWLNREVLRDDWGFDGVLISDCTAVSELINHGYAEDGADAACFAMHAGVDIEMVSACYREHIPALLEEGRLDIGLVDEAVLRVLELKEALGLFENPYKDASEEEESDLHLCKEHRELARKAAADSLVLLKNDGILPLQKSEITVAVIGPHANTRMHLDIWSGCGKEDECTSLADAMADRVKVVTSHGCGITDGEDEQIDEALNTASQADIVVLAVGEHPSMSGEAGSRAFLGLPGRQQELADRMYKLGKPVISVVFSGRPLTLVDLEASSNAVIEAWLPGTEGGAAIAEVLFGIRQPKGRLSVSFPYTVGQLPVYYNSLPTGRPIPDESDTERYRSRYCDSPVDPLHPFGYGLTYTSFTYGQPRLSKDMMDKDVTGDDIEIKLSIKNTGGRDGTEIAQLYIRDMGGSFSRPVRELKGFEAVCLSPGESRDVSFTITEEMLRYHTRSGYMSEPGTFMACIAPDAASGHWMSFTLLQD